MTDAFGGPTMLRYAMTLEALAVGVPGLVIVGLGLAAYRRRVVELERLIDPAERGAAHV
jgi:hypothetical protein